MTTTTSPRRPVISAWSAVSGFGIGRSVFTDGIAAGKATDIELDAEQWQAPHERACLVPGFDVRAELGRKGTRSMDRATALAVTTVGRLLSEERSGLAELDERSTALVLGTTTGSAQSIMDFTRDSIESDKPFFVDPARFPNTVMNCAAGQCAIWYSLRGPNTTVAGGRLAGLHALNYATRLLRAGRAETVLCGSVEEYSHARAWLDHHARADENAPATLGEGCAVWQIDHGGSEGETQEAARAEVLAVRFGALGPDGAGAALTRVAGRALAEAGVEPGELWAVAPCDAPGALGEAERSALDSVLGSAEPRRIVPSGLLGDAAAASAAFQISAALATAEQDSDAAGRCALITAVDAEGAVGCAVLRMC